ncbi:MAG: protein kinase [Acidobacteriota bacterium]|nr:protein kinase [Acidobacteriota bacterium]
MPINIGSRFDRYEIISLLGAGGMGEVYLARDTKLDRKVALKILPIAYTHDAERVRRFEKEARSASALNHPNIITIYEVGQAENAHFIATEYIEGQTLRKRMRRERMSVNEAIEVAMQIAGALHSAHSAGILHRDIKPENIMVRPDGYVKVLDFGLAKLTERTSSLGSIGGDGSPLESETDPGLVMGTATYMSPEQARAQKLDARSDVFSLGIVLYEMIAGRSPFHDQTASDVMAAILHREPVLLSRHFPGVSSVSVIPTELERIVHKALAKDREARYQSVKEMQRDLKNLRARLSSQVTAANLAHVANETGSDAGDFETSTEPRAHETEIVSAPNTSAGVIFSEIKKHKRAVISGLLLFVLVVAGIGFAIARWVIHPKEPVVRDARFTRLATPGRAIDAVISPDGKYAAYVVDDGGKRSLWIRQTAAGSREVLIVPATELRFRAPTFSRDGAAIFYVLRKPDARTGDLYRVASLGGMPRKLFSGVSSPVALSPDDTQVAYVRELADNGTSALIIASPDGTNLRELARRTLPDSFSIEGPDWSPDGKTIACPIANFGNGVNQNVVAVNVSDGTSKELTRHLWSNVGRVAWTGDGKGILMAAREPGTLGRQVWLASYPDGKLARVTNDLNDYRGVTASTDISTIAAVQINQISNLWVAPVNDFRRARQITFGSGAMEGTQGIAWTADGNLIYSSNASGKYDLWKINPNGGGQPQQLTIEGNNNSFPSLSADGRHIAFNSDRSGSVSVWRMDGDGGNPKQLTFGQLDLDPRGAPGNWVVFSSIKTGKRTLWKVPMDGGEPVQILEALSEYPVISPNGKLIACSYVDDKVSPTARFAIIPFEGGLPINAFDIPTTPWRLVRWSLDNAAVTYAISNNGAANIWSQPAAGGAPKQLTDFGSNQIFGFDWSPDGKWLACARGLETREIVLISSFR